MQINPGNFNKKIKIIKYELIKDEDGFTSKKEIKILETWAQVTNTSGTEIERSGSDFAEVKTRFLIRSPKIELDKDMEIIFMGKNYEIVYVNDYSYDKKYTEIMAKLVVK